MPPRKAIDPQIYITLKHGQVTVPLLTTAISPFRSILTELLESLNARYSKGIPSGPSGPSSPLSSVPKISVPESPSNIRIAVLHDKKDADKGWREIPWWKYRDDQLKNNLTYWDIEQGDILAFKFVEEQEDVGNEDEKKMKFDQAEFWVQWPNFDAMDAQDAMAEEGGMDRRGGEDGRKRQRFDGADSDEGMDDS